MRIFEILDVSQHGNFINKNVEGENVFSMSDAERNKLNGTTVFHQTKMSRLTSIIKTNGLRPRSDETGAREFGLPRVRIGQDFYIPKGVFASSTSNSWVGPLEFSWEITPKDKIARAYSSDGHTLFLNQITLDRLTITDLRTGEVIDPTAVDLTKKIR